MRLILRKKRPHQYKLNPLKKRHHQKLVQKRFTKKILKRKLKYAKGRYEPKPDIKQKYLDSIQSALYDNRETKTKVKNLFVKCHLNISEYNLARNDMAITAC